MTRINAKSKQNKKSFTAAKIAKLILQYKALL